jgi:hypothetical protein
LGGFANHHRGFVVDYARIVTPLYQVTDKKPFVWETEQVEAFEGLKEALVSPHVLALPVMSEGLCWTLTHLERSYPRFRKARRGPYPMGT